MSECLPARHVLVYDLSPSFLDLMLFMVVNETWISEHSIVLFTDMYRKQVTNVLCVIFTTNG